MKAVVLIALVALSAFVAITPVAEANHRCYTIGSYQMCRYIPGDEALDWVRDGCVPVGDDVVCLA